MRGMKGLQAVKRRLYPRSQVGNVICSREIPFCANLPLISWGGIGNEIASAGSRRGLRDGHHRQGFRVARDLRARGSSTFLRRPEVDGYLRCEGDFAIKLKLILILLKMIRISALINIWKIPRFIQSAGSIF
jgi:hypothetical protein